MQAEHPSAIAHAGLTGDELFALAESAPEFVAIAGLDNRVVYVNPAGRELVGLSSLEEARSHPVAGYLTDEGWKASLEVEQPAVLEDGTWHGRSTLRHFRSGEAIPVEITSFAVRDRSGSPILLATFQRDIREELVLEERVRSAEKLEAVGRLAGAVSHDFNNLLMVILGYAQLLADGVSAGSGNVERHAREILQAASQGSEITRRLLTLARSQSSLGDAIDVNGVISDNVPLLHRLVGDEIGCVVRLAPAAGFIEAEPAQLMQILLNLCANARDAQPDGGLVEIATDLVEEPIGEALGERNVLIQVRDAGVGIPAESLERVLEPFFTTKSASGGTGLGLASVAAIVREAGGDVLIASEPGVGTTVTVAFPEVPAPRELPAEPVAAPCGGAERILLLEDDPAVAQIVSLALEAQGYAVDHATDPEEARSGAAGRDPDLVIADAGVAGVRGRDGPARLRAHWPTPPILLVSGRDAPPGLEEAPGGLAFLAKPFPPSELLRQVRVLLDAV